MKVELDTQILDLDRRKRQKTPLFSLLFSYMYT